MWLKVWVAETTNAKTVSDLEYRAVVNDQLMRITLKNKRTGKMDTTAPTWLKELT